MTGTPIYWFSKNFRKRRAGGTELTGKMKVAQLIFNPKSFNIAHATISRSPQGENLQCIDIIYISRLSNLHTMSAAE